VPSIAAEQRSATAAEVIQKTREAATYLAKVGEKGITIFKSKNAQSFLKADGYIFVIDCEHGKILAHPIFVLAGTPLKSLHDGLNQPLAKPLCENGLKPNGSWFEAHLSRPNETKARHKLVYVRPVLGTTYQVASGIYDATVTLEYLNKLISRK
jgi:signal transduction histidine kinase